MSGYGWTEQDLARHMAKVLGGANSATPEQIRRGMRASSASLIHEGAAPKKRQKFNAQPTVSQGRRFASKKEAARYDALLLRLKAGEIRRLECQPVFVMHTENARGEWIACGKFTPDFRYQERHSGWDAWRERVEDVKGGRATRTEAYVLRRKHVEAEYGITITEI